MTRGRPGGERNLSLGSHRHLGLLVAMLLWLSILPQLVAEDQQAVAEICSTLQAATVRIVSGTEMSSGVIVTTEGHVLTVAHGLQKGSGSITIVFPNGKAAVADILLRDLAADVAVLKITATPEVGKLSPVPISLRSMPEKGHVVLAAGYPGREKTGQSPVVRLGELLAIEPQVLRSSCMLTAGDSGGPLLNHKGELIALHRQIGLGHESNLHRRIDRVRDVVAAVLNLDTITAAVHKAAALNPRLPEPSAEVIAALHSRTIEIRHPADDASPVILGTLLDPLHVATKLSELTPHAEILCRFSNGTPCAATIARSDVALDLAILKLAVTQAAFTALLPDARATDGAVRETCGRIVFASRGFTSVSGAGIVTRETYAEPPVTGKLGAVLELGDQTTRVQVNDVAPNSTAAKAGFAAQDLIITMNGHDILSLDDIANALKERQPGDWLQFDFQHKAKQLSAFAQLQHDPGARFERTEFLDGRSGRVSERRSGFENILQHDIPLAPSECGGPLCDSSGRIIAISIARRARESTLAVPIESVLRLINKDSP